MQRGFGRTLATLLATALAASSCDCTDAGQASVRWVTFNAGLAPVDVPYAAERAPAVVAALAEVRADLVCVQELWLGSDWDALVAATTESFPYRVRLPAEPVEALCTATEFEPLRACVEGACGVDAAGGELADCALASCGVEVGSLSAGCTDCLLGGIGAGADIGRLQTDCLGSGDSGAPEAFIYEGAYDTGILSALPFLEQDSFVLDSYLLRAAVNYARVETDLGRLHVFCTHLASAIPQFEYEGAHGSWRGEQARQIEQLLEFIDEKTGGSGTVVVLGDLNCGPALVEHDIEPEWADHYAALLAAGLRNPYAEQADVACTSCPESSFHAPDSDGSLIDHALLGRFRGSARVERILDEPVTIDVEGQPIETHLSDHFGLAIELEGEAR